MSKLIKDLSDRLNPSMGSLDTEIESNWSIADMLQYTYPTMLFLKNLPEKENIVVGIFINKEGLIWNSTFVASILTAKSIVVVPKFPTRLALISYLNKYNVNVLLVSEDNPFEVEDFADTEHVFHNYYNLAIVYDVFSARVLYSKNSTKNHIIQISDLSNFKRIPTRNEWEILIDKDHELKLYLPSSSITNIDPNVAVFYNSTINTIVDLLSLLFDKNWSVNEIYMDIPKWKYPFLSVLFPLINDFYVDTWFDSSKEYDSGVFTAADIKELIDSHLYKYYEKAFSRWNIPVFILKYFGKRSLKKSLSNIHEIIILNCDLPSYYIRVLKSIGKKVVTTYGSVETGQLTAVNYHRNKTEDLDDNIGGIIPTLHLEDSEEPTSRISGSTIADEFYYKNNHFTNIAYFEIDDWIKKIKGNYLLIDRTDNIIQLSNGDTLLSSKVINIFKTNPFVKNASILTTDEEFHLVVEINKKLSTRFNFSYEKIKDILDNLVKSYNRKVDIPHQLGNVLFTTKLQKGLDGRPLVWLYKQFHFTES